MGLMRQDGSYSLSLTCHPNLVKFLEGIRNETAEFKRFCSPALLMTYGVSSLKDVFRVESSWRTFSEQANLYLKGRNARDAQLGIRPVTNAKAGDSFHNWGLAVDIIFTRWGYLDNGAIAEYPDPSKGAKKIYRAAQLGDLYADTGLAGWAQACGVRWAGRDTDLPDPAHFETYHMPPEGARKESNAVTGWWDREGDLNKDFLTLAGEGVSKFFDKALFWAFILGLVYVGKKS